MHDDDRAGSEADHLLRDAAEEEAGEPAMATTPDDDEIRLPVPGCSNDLLGGVTESRLGRDRRRAFRPSRSARPVEHALSRREGELGCGYLDMLHPRIFLEGGIDP